MFYIIPCSRLFLKFKKAFNKCHCHPESETYGSQKVKIYYYTIVAQSCILFPKTHKHLYIMHYKC